MKKVLYLLLAVAVGFGAAKLMDRCSDDSSDNMSYAEEGYDYYEEGDSALILEAGEEYAGADYVLLDSVIDWDMDSVYDPNYEYVAEVVEEAPVAAPAPTQPIAAPQKTVNKVEKPVSPSSLRDKLEKRTEELYELFSGRCDEFDIATVFYDKEDNKVNIMVALANKDKYSKDDKIFISKAIAEFVRQTVYRDTFDGEMFDDDAKLLYDVNPIFRVTLIGSSFKGEPFEYTIKETYDKR